MKRQRGFTLIELVVSIVVAAIVVGFMSMFLVTPVNAYLAQERRTELADSANNAMRMMEQDIRNALPRSVRIVAVGGNLALELLYVSDFARYRPNGSSGVAAQDLTTGAPDKEFSTLGRFTNHVPGGYTGYLAVMPAVGGNPYALTGVISPYTMITIGAPVSGEQPVLLGADATFTTDSPTRSAYYVTGPVSYVCNPATGTLKRFEGYGISANQATHATEAQLVAAGASSSLVAKNLSVCTFQPGTPPNAELILLRMTFASSNESVQVLDQVQVENVP